MYDDAINNNKSCFGNTGMCVCSIISLFNLLNCSPSGYSTHGIFHPGILEWVAASGYLPVPGTEPASLESLVLAGGIFITVPPGKSGNISSRQQKNKTKQK